MTAKRAAAYCGGGLMLLAGLSFAGGLGRQTSGVADPSVPVETTGTASLAAEVQAQTSRLKTRLAQSPLPVEPGRNPFSFAPREAVRRSAQPMPRSEALPDVILPPAEPAIELVGVAENRTERGIVRTAIVSSLSGDLFLVKEGEALAGRYTVKAIGADVVELNDLLSGETRRLALRH